MRKEITGLLLLCSGLISVILECSAETFGYSASPDCMRVEITTISYQGESTYKIMMSLTNVWNKKISITTFEEKFFVQSEVIGQWIKLADHHPHSKGEGSSLPPGRQLNFYEFVKIPMSTPTLYLNGFGQVNLRFLYELNVCCGEKAEFMSQTGEKFYWITPGTNKWTLREGM
jgi:hypothetical protein